MSAGEQPQVETALDTSSPESPEGSRWQIPSWATFCEASVFVVFAVFFIIYGVTPLLGGDGMGLVGADEPRYAQIAHEMLVRFDSAHTLKERLSACVTPYLYGHPWLEKPALYYWRAMFVFQDFGVHDWSARLPSASFAFIMAALIYLHMRRFRRGGHLDAALITVACAGIIGFSRGASTDMQMAAPLSIGLLGWYAWYETDSKFWLFDIYFFTGVATLAKGPVAPFLAFSLLPPSPFCGASGRSFCAFLLVAGRRCSTSPSCCPGSSPCSTRTQPSSASSFSSTTSSALPPIATSTSSPSGTTSSSSAGRDAVDRDCHPRPGRRHSDLGGRVAAAPLQSRTSPRPSRPGDAFPEFLVLWALIPIVFFSFSQSKLPGYILPSIPPITILTGDYLFRCRQPRAQPLDSVRPRRCSAGL